MYAYKKKQVVVLFSAKLHSRKEVYGLLYNSLMIVYKSGISTLIYILDDDGYNELLQT